MYTDITDNFNEKILDIIKRCSYDMYLINIDNNIECTCMRHETKQGDPGCPKCLGTGYKIIIRKFSGASQDSEVPTTMRTDRFYVARSTYLRDNIPCNKEDILIDNNVVYKVLDIQKLYSLKGTLPYKKITSIKRKFDTDIIIDNFNRIISKQKQVTK